jgi:hypothetical protein
MVIHGVHNTIGRHSMDLGGVLDRHNALCHEEGRGHIDLLRFFCVFRKYGTPLLSGLPDDIVEFTQKNVYNLPMQYGYPQDNIREAVISVPTPSRDDELVYTCHMALVLGAYLIEHYPGLAKNKAFQKNLRTMAPRDGVVERAWKVRAATKGYPKWPLAVSTGFTLW